MAAFPAAKLGILLFKQVSKPIANYLKERAKKHPFFRKHFCMPPAQFYNWCEVKMKMWLLNLGKPVEIPKLSETMAIELGANLLGESIIFSIAAALLFMEYSRQVRKEAAKEAARKTEITTINYTIQELYFQAERQETEIKELMRIVADIKSKIDRIKPPRGPFPIKPKGHDPPPASKVFTQSKCNDLLETNLQMRRYSGGVVFNALDYITYQIPYEIHNRKIS